MLHFYDMKNPWVILGALTVILIAGSIWYSSTVTSDNNEGITEIEHVKGNPDASVILTEYSDFQCPACAAFHPVVVELLEQYGDQVRFEYKHFPLPIHTLAQAAARAAEAAGQQGKFFEYHDVLFEQQAAWSVNPNPTAAFVGYATGLGLDEATFRRHFNASLIRDRVRDDLNEARQLGLTGTPTFFLNGERMQFTTYQQFTEQVARAIDPSYVAPSPAGEQVLPVGDAEVRFGL